MKWLKHADEEWYTAESEGKLYIKYFEDYREIVGGDFYEYIPLERYLVMDWNNPKPSVLKDCDSLEEAQEALLGLLTQP